MKITEILFEALKLNHDDLSSLKSVIANKIKQLPEDDATIKALKEIEDLIAHIHSGGKLGIISDKLQQIKDPTVASAQKMLSRYILSIDMTPQQRDELFNLWKSDKLVNKSKLLSSGKHNFSEIINKYDSNPAIAEFVNDLMRVAALGQGKGEFGLSVLSKGINKPPKGDLIVDGKKVEVKTTDGGAGRFTDQEVRPAAGFEDAASAVHNFISKVDPNTFPQPELLRIPKSGVSLGQTINIYKNLQDKDKNTFLNLISQVIRLIFGGKSSNRSDIDAIIKGIKNGNMGEAMQAYSKASFNYYMGMKDDEGVLYIDLTTTPISTVYFTDADDLAKSGVRFHAGTVYLTSVKDPRLPYPQMQIIVTKAGSAGSNVKGSPEPTVKPKAKAKPVPVAEPRAKRA